MWKSWEEKMTLSARRLSNHVAGGSSQASQLNWKTVFSSTWLLVPVSLDELLDVVVLVLFVKENLFFLHGYSFTGF